MSLQPEYDDQELLARFGELIKNDKSNVLQRQLLGIMQSEQVNAQFSVIMDSKLLLEDDVVLGHLVLREPTRLLELFSKAFVSEQERIVASDPNNNGGKKVKQNVHARVNWLPSVHRKANISSIRSHDVGIFVQFSGTVVRSGMLKVLEAVRVFRCGNPKCDVPIRVSAAVNEVGSIVQRPTGPCPHCKRSSSYTESTSEKVCHDYQEIRVQEHVQKLGMGSIPRAITVILMHDLCDKCKAGDDVVITGIPLNRWGPTYKDERCVLETMIMGNTVHVGNAASANTTEFCEDLVVEFERYWANHNVDPLKGRDAIVASICPQLFGLYVVKLAVLLTLIGSPTTMDPKSGTRVRGDPHLLLVGDPGTGKSQFLRFACKLSPRAVLTTGVGTTSAGLTCSAIREGSEFMLEAGALVLADHGLCCIDEFGSIREHDRATIHEAMEQQSLSVAKAGLVTKLNTRATIIAATNPKGNYDVDADLSANTGIAPPLLSRFDLVIVLLDSPDIAWDRVVSETILKTHAVSEDDVTNGNDTKRQRVDQVPGTGAKQYETWTLEKLRAYLFQVKQIDPELTEEAGEVLSAYYSLHRRSDQEAGRTTLRFLESLVRLSKAHARLMYRNRVLIGDALVAILLTEASQSTATSQNLAAALHVDFPKDPDAYFKDQAKALLDRLRLGHLDPSFADREENDRTDNAIAPSAGSSQPSRGHHQGSGLQGHVPFTYL